MGAKVALCGITALVCLGHLITAAMSADDAGHVYKRFRSIDSILPPGDSYGLDRDSTVSLGIEAAQSAMHGAIFRAVANGLGLLYFISQLIVQAVSPTAKILALWGDLAAMLVLTALIIASQVAYPFLMTTDPETSLAQADLAFWIVTLVFIVWVLAIGSRVVGLGSALTKSDGEIRELSASKKGGGEQLEMA